MILPYLLAFVYVSLSVTAVYATSQAVSLDREIDGKWITLWLSLTAVSIGSLILLLYLLSPTG